MKVVLKNVIILDKASSHHGMLKDILVNQGIIEQIADNITADDAQLIEGDNLYVTNGFIDCFADFSDPGYEYKETLQTGALAALKGGYTAAMLVPNTIPCTENKTGVEYLIHEGKKLPIKILPIGAITHKTEGTKLTEMIEMQQVGAVAFSDGWQSVQNAGLLLKALLYVKSFDGVVIDIPYDAGLSSNGFMHEGIMSTQLGLLGIPSIAEETIVARNIELCAYANSRLHITGISTAKSVALVKNAKAKGINITSSVAPYHLLLTDEAVADYNTNAKVLNPLRTKSDVIALQAALLDGTIDCVASHHRPQDVDNKNCEFAYAAYGMSTIEHTFNIVASIPNITPETIEKVLYYNPSKIFGGTNNSIAANNYANLTIFNLTDKAIVDTEHIISKSKHSAFIGLELKGKVFATVNNTNIYIA